MLAAFYFAWLSQQNTPPAYAGYLAADKGYGVTIDLTQYDEAALAASLAALQDNGLLWLRQPVAWADVEPEPGQYQWQALDRVLVALQQYNDAAADQAKPFKVIAVLQTTPAWARPSHTPVTAPPVERHDFGAFARALAGRYHQEIDYYQVWDEPNLSATWGNAFVDPAQYAALLQEAALNIREVDRQAVILTAALAPTLENGPLNLNEMAYLDQLYQAGAAPWFDVVAGQPYGFDFEATDPAHPGRLNFRRLELLRQVMLAHGEAEKPIWATAFGWAILPVDWAGQPPPWRSDQNRLDPPEVQLERTAAAIRQARREWPWLGPMFAPGWDSTGLAPDDPARGFAPAEIPPLLSLFRQAAGQTGLAMPGNYPVAHPSGSYSPGWRFSPLYADIPQGRPGILTISFEGERLDLDINRGPYRGYLWVTVDGQPANALPQDGSGRSYIVLNDPLYAQARVTLAQNLAPTSHQAVIEAEGGWGQWAIAGWAVYNKANPRPFQARLWFSLAVAALSGLGLAWSFRLGLIALLRRGGLGANSLARRYLALAEPVQVAVSFILALGVHFAPGGLTWPLLLALSLVLLLRPDLGLALVTFSLSFFLATRPLPPGLFWPVESLLFITALGFACKEIPQLTHLKSKTATLKPADWAALILLGLGFAATLAAPNFGVSMFEWRVLVAESVLFYFLVRLGWDYGPAGTDAPRRWAWRLADAFVAGAALHAILALWLYFFTGHSILAEGVRRAVGPVYGSPNNLALFLDRAWPLLLAVALFPGGDSEKVRRPRRWGYALGFCLVSLALYLTFSKGALVVGLPSALIAMTLFYLWHRRGGSGWRTAGLAAGGLIVMLIALLPLSRTQRFQTLLNFDPGSTGFFRLKVWQAALEMLGDHWLLGVGLNNFLYQYRTRYILPEAWQEPDLSHPHNLALDFGTRLGLGGVILLGWLQIVFWRTAWRLYRQQPEPLVLGLMGSMVVFLSHGLVDNAYFLVDLAFAFFLTLGLVQGLAEREQE